MNISRTITGALALAGGFAADALGAPPQVGQALRAVGAPAAVSGARFAIGGVSRFGISRSHLGGLALGAAEIAEMAGQGSEGVATVSTALRTAGMILSGVGLRSAIGRAQ